jgi:ornithine carbamoyltransferase
MRMSVGAPESLWPAPDFIARLDAIAAASGARITFEADPAKAVAGSDFLYTDVWLSMGEDEHLWADRIKLLLPYQINKALLEATGNKTAKFMHCLPAFHNTETTVGKDIEKRYGVSAMEVTDEVFESEHSIVFDQAENRMHSIKAILVATLS